MVQGLQIVMFVAEMWLAAVVTLIPLVHKGLAVKAIYSAQFMGL